MTLVVALVLIACAVAASLRWLRVAQFEHYLPGSTRAVRGAVVPVGRGERRDSASRSWPPRWRRSSRGRCCSPRRCSLLVWPLGLGLRGRTRQAPVDAAAAHARGRRAGAGSRRRSAFSASRSRARSPRACSALVVPLLVDARVRDSRARSRTGWLAALRRQATKRLHAVRPAGRRDHRIVRQDVDEGALARPRRHRAHRRREPRELQQPRRALPHDPRSPRSRHPGPRRRDGDVRAGRDRRPLLVDPSRDRDDHRDRCPCTSSASARSSASSKPSARSSSARAVADPQRRLRRSWHASRRRGGADRSASCAAAASTDDADVVVRRGRRRVSVRTPAGVIDATLRRRGGGADQPRVRRSRSRSRSVSSSTRSAAARAAALARAPLHRRACADSASS